MPKRKRGAAYDRDEKREALACAAAFRNFLPFKQDNVKVENINAPIEVIDVSKAGIGFKTESVLPTGYYFNARLELGGDSALNCVVRILRQQDKGDYFVYGCEIVGAAAIMDYVVNDYAATLQ